MKNIKIILVDDHLLFREGVKLILECEKQFKIVGEGTNGLEAISLVDSLKPDIVLMDVNMPEMDGIEATKQIGALHPNTKVMILSVHAEEKYVLDSLRNGAFSYLIKEMSHEELIRAIKHVMNGGKYLHPKVTGYVIDSLVKTNKDATLEANLPLHILTSRECEVLQLLTEGHNNKTMAELLHISDKTIKNHLTSIFQKLHVVDRTQAVLMAISKNWVLIKQ